MVLNGPKWCKMVINGKNCQKWYKIAKKKKKGKNGLKWSIMVPNGPNWFKMVKNGQNHQKWSKWPKMVKIVKKW